MPHPTDHTLALVELTRGYWAVIDAADSAEVGKYNWFANTCASKKTVYAGTNHDLIGSGAGCTYLQRFIAFLHKLDLSGLVDHRNGNGLDCRQQNLRPATKSTNAQNRGIDKNNTSGVKGVHYEAFTGRWRAEIWINKKHLRLGRFTRLSEAEDAVTRARAEHHGEFANDGGRRLLS